LLVQKRLFHLELALFSYLAHCCIHRHATKQEKVMNALRINPWQSIVNAIDARVAYARAEIYLGDMRKLEGSIPIDDEHVVSALIFAAEASESQSENASMPGLLDEIPLLRARFTEAVRWRQRYRREMAYEARARRERRRRRYMAYRCDWTGLEYPTPQEALTALMAGNTIEANGHRISWDDDDQVVWCTNPYGVDTLVCSRNPTVVDMRRFLRDMAYGRTYGRTPD
jgi:hypothetical protein